jgi:hypothetical protein
MVSYPPESSFYPIHFIIALVTTALFTIIIFSYRQFLKRTEEDRKKISADGKKTKTTQILGAADAIALGTLILGIIGTGLFPTIQSSLLDYSTDISENGKKLTVSIRNLGLAPANNVFASVSADGITFSNLESEPFLSNHFRGDDSTSGKAFFEINVLPPRSETLLTATTDASNVDMLKDLEIFVRSDDKVGYHDTIITSIFYLILGLTYIGLFIYLVYWGQIAGIANWTPLNKRKWYHIASYIAIIFVGELLATGLIIRTSLFFPL